MYFLYYFYIEDKYYMYKIFNKSEKYFVWRYFLSASPRSLMICDHDMPWTRDSELKKYSLL